MMSTVPEPAGLVAVIWVALLTVYVVAGMLPKVTAFAPVKFVPVIVTELPPANRPAGGEIPVTTGIPIYVNLSFAETGDVPLVILVTVTSKVPAVWAGLVTVIRVSLLTVMAPVALAVLPNFTVFAPVKPFPVMVTVVPPAAVPEVGEMPVTAAGTPVKPEFTIWNTFC